jgi:hypothetical protein
MYREIYTNLSTCYEEIRWKRAHGGRKVDFTSGGRRIANRMAGPAKKRQIFPAERP